METFTTGEIVFLRTNTAITYVVIGFVTMGGAEQIIVSNEDGIEYRYVCELEKKQEAKKIKGFKND